MWCPLRDGQPLGGSRRPDIVRIGHQDITHIPAGQEMQGVDGSAVVGSGGQHTEPAKTVHELADCLAVATHEVRQLHIGSCDLSHLQGYFNALDAEDGFCPDGCGHQPVQAPLPVNGRLAVKEKIKLGVGENDAIVYKRITVTHSL
ncbi:hypothetical protein I6E20_10205 [Bacteroides caecigallinarum]|nr:hypothetical protein [Bacteroides caecigallinarum]